MHTTRSSSHLRGVSTQHPGTRHPPGADPPECGPGDPLDRSPSTSSLGVGLETPLARSPSTSPWVWAWRPPWPDPPQLPPWVWAWKPARHAGIPPPPPRPAARHAETPPARHVGKPPPQPPPPETCCKACWDTTYNTCNACWDTTNPLWTEFLTHTCENITLPQTSFACGNNSEEVSKDCWTRWPELIFTSERKQMSQYFMLFTQFISLS